MRLCLLVAILSISIHSSAQDTDPFSYNANIRPSAQAWEMTKYGNLTPSLYTGTFHYSLPIYTYKDPDFEIPVSLEYSFNGYRPSQPSGTVGLGWTLNCGGAITREIVGLPDEYDTTEGSTHIYGYYMFAVVGVSTLSSMQQQLSNNTFDFNSSTPAYCFKTTPYIFSGNEPCLLGNIPYLMPASENLAPGEGFNPSVMVDPASDIYHFSYPGGKGSFVILPSGEIKVFDSTAPEGEISVSMSLNHDSRISAIITIATGDGYVYTYGCFNDSDYIEYSYDVVNLGPGSAVNFSAIKLYSITAPNGRQVTFNYNVPANGLPYKDVSYKYKTRISQGFYSSLSNMKQDATLMMTVYSPLRGVLVDGDEIIRFNYSSKDSDEYGTNAFSSGFQNLRGSSVSHVTNNTDNKRLSSIVITSPDDFVIDNIQLSHIYSSDAGGHSPKMFLSTVNSKNGLSSFDYHNASSSSVYPPVDCDETDHWGFWRGSGGYYLFSANNIHHQDTSLYNLINQNKDPVTAYASYGALICIHYPTGGSSEIEYEANYADKRLDIDLTGNAGYFLDNVHCQTGGLRVAKIVNTSGQYRAFRDSVTFSYNGSGILSYMPRYSAEVFVSVPLSSSFIAYPITCSNGISFRNDPSNHIGYSCVSAHYSDGSHTDYVFNDYVSHPDHYLSRSDALLILVKVLYLYDAATGNYDFSGYYAPDAASERYAASVTGLLLDNGGSIRGSLKAERDYTAEGLLIKSITQNYTNSTACSLNTMFNCLSYCCVAPRVFHSPRLESVVTTNYRSGGAVTTTTAYTYNAKGQCISETTTSNTLSDGYKTSRRYWHEIDDEAPAGNVSDIVRSRLRGNNEYITSLYHFTYNDTLRTLPVRKTSYNILTPYPTQTPFSPQTGDSTVVTMSYDSDNHWRPFTVSFPGDAYIQFAWDTSGRYILSREDNGPANKTYYQWQDMVGLSHITYPTGQGEYYGYDSHNRLCSVDNTWQEPLARYDYHLVNGGDTLTGGTNFIRRTSYLRPAISYKDISYYDGLGYPAQDVALDAGSAGHVVTPKWLDPMRREDARLYLPYPSDVYTFDASAISSQQNWYLNRFGSGETYNYQENRYESSPAGKKISSRLPGAAYRSHCDTIVYRVNTAADSVLNLTYNTVSSPSISVNSSFVSPGGLACTAVTDADGHIAETFSDAFGHVVLSRSRGDGDKADTYYVRDMKDSLVCVIQPMGSAMISRGTTLELSPSSMSSVLDDYAFVYTYDARGRMTSRKNPGIEREEFTYDERDRIDSSSDANLRDDGRKIKYEYDDYDCLIRKSLVNASNDATVVVLAEYAYDRTGYQCSGENAPPVASALAYTNVQSGIPWVFDPATSDRTGTSLGQKYYEKQLVLEGGNYSYGNPRYVERAFYYDNLGRLLQSVEKNAQGGITRESFNYDFAGNLVTRHISATAGDATVTKLTAINRDTRGRVTEETTYINGSTTPTSFVIFTYDVLGRQNAINDGGLVQADHYGLQGWVSYRASELTAGGVTSDVFSEYLHREDPVYPSPSWTGHITEVFWMHGGQPIGTYALTYDGFGRLKDAWRYMYGQPTNAWSERGISYDKNGNILSLLRYGSSETTPDNNYSISYEGNRASMLNNSDYYEYDFNGNITGDAARNMAIGYNVLNFPSWFNDGQSDLMVFYDYLADGTKVAMHREDTGLGLAWLGDIVFNLQEDARAPEDPGDGSRGTNAAAKRWRDTTGTYMKVAKNVNLRSDGPDDENPNVYYSFESTPYAGGRLEANGTGLTVRKYVTDHLGSVRVIVTNNAVVERSDYYPFGSKHPNTTFPTLTSNRYGFSGKERQNISSSLDPYIDFGARFYDPLTARWLQQDPMADKYTSLTQYNYCGNNPVNFVDPDGLDWYEKNMDGVVDYVYFDHKLSDEELRNGNYTHMGYTLVKNNTYYSLFGRKLPYGVSGGKPSLGNLYEKIDKMIITAQVNPLVEGRINRVSFYLPNVKPGTYTFQYNGLSFKSKNIVNGKGKFSGTIFRAVDETNSMGYISRFPMSIDKRGGWLGSQSFPDYWLIISNGKGNGDGYDLVRIRFDKPNALAYTKAFNNLFSTKYTIK